MKLFLFITKQYGFDATLPQPVASSDIDVMEVNYGYPSLSQLRLLSA